MKKNEDTKNNTAPADDIKQKAKTSEEKTAEKQADVHELGKEIPAWELVGIMKMKGWAVGKQLTEKEFESARKEFSERQMGA